MQQSRFGIYIGNVDRSVSLEQLKVLFSQCGNIVDASMNGSAENAYRFAFMDYASENERAQAMRLDGVMLANRPLKVAASKGHVNHSGGGGMGGSRPPQHNGYAQQQQPMHYGQQPPMMGGGGYPPQQPYGGMQYMPPQQPSPQVIQQIIASMQAQGQLRPGQEPTQQQLQAIAAAALAVQQPPPMMGGGGYPGYPPQQQQMRPPPPSHAPVNPAPTLEAMALRAKQREQYLEKLRSEGERYETKIKKLLARGRGEAGGSGSDSEGSSNGSSSDSDDDEKRAGENGDQKQAASNQNNGEAQPNSQTEAAVAAPDTPVVLGEKREREDSIEA